MQNRQKQIQKNSITREAIESIGKNLSGLETLVKRLSGRENKFMVSEQDREFATKQYNVAMKLVESPAIKLETNKLLIKDTATLIRNLLAEKKFNTSVADISNPLWMIEFIDSSLTEAEHATYMDDDTNGSYTYVYSDLSEEEEVEYQTCLVAVNKRLEKLSGTLNKYLTIADSRA